MAYMDQDLKRELMTGIKKVLNKYGMKATFRVRNSMVLQAVVRSGKIDFESDMAGVNVVTNCKGDSPYIHGIELKGQALAFFKELGEAMHKGNHNHSDPVTDYFNVGWYVDIYIGERNKSYIHQP